MLGYVESRLGRGEGWFAESSVELGLCFGFYWEKYSRKRDWVFFFFIGWWCNFGYLVLKVSRGFF